MLQILEFIPIVLFFVTYKMDGTTVELFEFSHQLDGIYSATAVLMIATLFYVAVVWLVKRHIEQKIWWMLVAVVAFGSLTLLFRNELFIQWKPTVFNWGLAVLLIGKMIFTKKNMLEQMLGSQLQMPHKAWHNLNLLWITQFIVVGALNIYVAFNFSEAFWVSYKLYSSIGFTLFLMISSALIVTPYLKEQTNNQ